MKMFVEMSRESSHGGHGWEFARCLWAPAKKANGSDWPFWNKVLDVRRGDIVVHLRGRQPNASIVGTSTALEDGRYTRDRPPIVGHWGFAQEFVRVDLENFTPFPSPILLNDLFQNREEELVYYFKQNKELPADQRKNLFYVFQSSRLQCLNGAYLSDLDEYLANILFGSDFSGEDLPRPPMVSVATGERINVVRARWGQAKFSARVKLAFGGKCCFPGCNVDDNEFLIGAHIARWADSPQLRGRMDNGLCLCLMHDKAFENGYFTLTDDFKVVPLGKDVKGSVFSRLVEPFAGMKIELGSVAPSLQALSEHRKRVSYYPVLS